MTFQHERPSGIPEADPYEKAATALYHELGRVELGLVDNAAPEESEDAGIIHAAITRKLRELFPARSSAARHV